MDTTPLLNNVIENVAAAHVRAMLAEASRKGNQ